MNALQLIHRIDRSLATHRPDYYAQLRPGLSATTLTDFEKRFSVHLPDSFRSFYQWKDGQPDACSESFHANWMFMPLARVIESKEICDGMIGLDFEDPSWWRRGWIPFLEDGGGNNLCLDLTAENGGKPGQLIEFWHADADRPIEYPDFDLWLYHVAAGID
jgi:cell wall assembly regulator SMI1